jgi:outer membrane biosynthesis protein TonB
MRTLCMLALIGSIQIIRAQENSHGSITTNSAEVATHPRTIRPLTNGATNLNRRTASKGKRSEDAKHVAVTLSYDEKTESFGVYDRTVSAAVENRWRELLGNIKHDGYAAGKVVLQFHLNHDGRVSELKLIERTAGETLSLACQQAVLDLSPFPRWPREMHKQVAADFRRLTLTFHYPPDEVHRER